MPATAERTRDTASEDRPSGNRPVLEGRVTLPVGRDGSEPAVREIRWCRDSIELHSPLLFGEEAALSAEARRRCGLLVERLLGIEAITSLSCDRPQGVLTLSLASGSGADVSDVMRRACRALTAEPEVSHRTPVRLWSEVPAGSFEFHRYGRLITSWTIIDRTTEALTLANPVIAGNPLKIDLFQDALIHLEGVGEVSAEVGKGHLRVLAIPGQRLDEELLLRTLEQIEGLNPLVLADLRFPKADLRLPVITVALASAAQWLSPSFWPVAAAMIIGLNLPMLRRGIAELRKGLLGLPILTVLIVTGTMIGGALFAASLMTLTSRFWQNRYFSLLALAQSEWLGQLAVSRGEAMRCLPDSRKEMVSIDRLKPGDVIEIKAPESIPADGDWIDGEGEVVQAFGETVIGRVTEGDVTFRLYAGGWLRSGRILMRVSAAGDQTRARRVRGEILQSSGVLKGSVAVNQHGQAFAERTVVPSLALAGLGLATVGLSEAVAVLRPDYAMGVGLGEGLQRLRLGAEALHEGFLVRDTASALKLGSIDLWIVERNCLDLATRQAVTRSAAVAEIIGPSWIDMHTANGTMTTLRGFAPLDGDVERAQFVGTLRKSGVRKIGWIGDAEAYPLMASAVDLAMSTNTDFESAHPAAAVVNLAAGKDPNWNRIFELVNGARNESLGLRLRAMAPNVAAVTGALFMGFDSLAAVVLTNLGIYSVHRRVRKPGEGERKEIHVEHDGFRRNGHP